MADISKRVKRLLRDCAAAAHEEELRRALLPIAEASNRPDDALREGILPGRSRRDEDLANSQTLHPPCEHVAVDGIPIAEQVLRRRLFWEALDQLVGGPGRGWVDGDVHMG